MQPRMIATSAPTAPARVLLIGPYDPKCGEYTFLAPPLGVWRLAGHLQDAGVETQVFDPNCCGGSPEAELADILRDFSPRVIGLSTTGMTLNYDLTLAHIARSVCPTAILVAGGMEATFDPERMFSLGPFDLVVLGEGEKPLLALVQAVDGDLPLIGIPGVACKNPNGSVIRHHAPALDVDELTTSIMNIPYEQMPYERYWEKLEHAYSVGDLPVKADREARLSEIRSARLITLNYCPMGCSFCSSTNFLHEAEGRVAKVARLSADACVEAIDKILDAHPGVRTIIFQDDIFVFTNDERILPLCDAIIAKKTSGAWPRTLRFISTNRIDAMTPERLQRMYQAGFRVLGFGIESFSESILKEFNKRLIYKHIGPNLKAALDAGFTPFLDLIMSSPRCSVDDIATNIRHAHFWLERGCEIGLYPFVIPFAGAAMAKDESLEEHTEYETMQVEGTAIRWRQPTRILPIDPDARSLMLAIEDRALGQMAELEARSPHLPSRVRSLVWIAAASRQLEQRGFNLPDYRGLAVQIDAYLGLRQALKTSA